MEAFVKSLIEAAAESEKQHRQFQAAERYGNAAYYQGRRDAFALILEQVARAVGAIEKGVN